MNTASIAGASRVICEAMGRPNSVPATIAVALDAGGWLNLAETAAELVALRARVAELELLEPARHQTCRTCGAGYEYGKPCSNCEFQAQMAAAVAARPGRRTPISHDLPERPRA